MDLVDFDISIRPGADDHWQVTFGPIQETTSRPFDLTTVENIRLKVEMDGLSARPVSAERRRRGHRASASQADKVLRRRGEELFSSIFCSEIGRQFERAFHAARRSKKHLRIRIRTGQDLVRYPFEIMACQKKPVTAHLGLLLGSTIIRSPLNEISQAVPERIKPPLRILLVGSSPEDHPPINVEGEIEALRAALELPELIEIATLSGKSTLFQLEKLVGKEFHILHYTGHGTYNAERDEGMLIFEDGRGQEDPISAVEFMNLVYGIERLRLVTLNSCLGAAGDGHDPLSAVATSLFDLGLPAVVAMQNRITDSAAVEFASQFYRDIALGRPIDQAITFARAAMHRMADPPSPEWATPVLFMRTEDGSIFGLELPTGELLDHALRHLRGGQWGAAKQTAAFAAEQHPETAAQCQDIGRVAEQASLFQERWQDLEETLSLEAHDQLTEVTTDLATAAEAIEQARFEALLGDEPGIFPELAIAAEAVKSFAGQDYQAVIDLCDQFHQPEIFHLEKLRQLAESDRRDRQARHRVKKAWSSGDWHLARQVVGRALESKKPTTRWRAELARKNEILEQLTGAADALGDEVTAEDLRQALELAKNVPADKAPPNLELFRQAVALGLRAADSQADNSRKDYASVLWDLRKLARSGARGKEEWRKAKLLAGIPGGDRLCHLILLGRRWFAYRKAVAFYESGCYSRASRLLAQLLDYEDSSVRHDLCRKWLEVIDHARREEWGAALTVLDSLSQERSRVRPWRRWCKRAPKVLAALDHMAEEPLICESRVPWEEGGCPYEVFQQMNVTPSSTMAQCKEIGLDAQAKYGRLSDVQRQASDALRLPKKRLLVDFGLYTVADPDRVRSLVTELRSITEGAPPGMSSMKIVETLENDGGILLALCGEREDYQGAVSCFLRQARREPHDMRALHHAGVAAAALIQCIEESDNDLGLAEAWEMLIVGWGAIFADDRFWHDWWIQRRQVYQAPVKEHEIQSARLQLQRFWLDQLKSSTDVCPGIDAVFQAEINAGRAVLAGGGIPLPGDPERHAVAGPLGISKLGLIEQVKAWTASFDVAALATPGWQQRVCRYFSELSTATALFEDGRYEDVIAALGDQAPAADEKAPGFAGFADGTRLLATARRSLLQESHSKLALKAVSELPPEIDKSLGHWQAALEVARQGGDAEELLAEIRDVALGRAEYLRNESPAERRTQALDSAVKLLASLHDERWDDPQRRLRKGLIEAYLDYAVHLSNEYDDEEGARHSAHQAYRLAPESLRAIIVLCQASLHFAREKYLGGQQPVAEALLREVEGYLEDGEKLFPSNADIDQCRRMVEHLRKMMNEPRKGWEEPFDSSLDTDPGQEKVQAYNPLVEAMVKEAQEEYSEAIEIYWDLVQKEPEKPGIREKMAICYRFWILHIFETESVSRSELLSIVRLAKERCPDSETLRDIFAQFDANLLNDDPEEEHDET